MKVDQIFIYIYIMKIKFNYGFVKYNKLPRNNLYISVKRMLD